MRSGELALYLPLRFYMMDCSKAKLCANYTNDFPSLFCFRPKFLLKFHRTWSEEKVTYWVRRAARPALQLVDSWRRLDVDLMSNFFA